MDGPVFRLPPFTVSAEINAQDVSEVLDWGLIAYGVEGAWKITRGHGVRVAVLDTGCDTSHPDLIGQFAVEPRDFTGSSIGAGDVVRHGTHCAGVIAANKNGQGVVGVACEAKLIIGKVLGDDGSGQGSWVAAGIDWAVAQGAHIISMSLGSSANDPRIEAALKRAVAAGAFVIIAAGNSGPFNPGDIDYPARLNLGINVAAINKAGNISDFSSRGPSVTFAAPGEQILSTIPGGRYARMSGTSMATPFLAGAVALLVARHLELGGAAKTPLKRRQDVIDHLKGSALDVATPGFDAAAGWGVVKVDKLIEAEQPAPPVVPPPTDAPTLDLGPVKIYMPARSGDRMGVNW